jgi:7-keto-8-aminopelargonate synthetase-like enzyme
MEEETQKRNVEFETVKQEKINFGRNNFLEIARKKAVTDDGTNEFISVSRGYYLPDGSERFKRSIAIPDDSEIKDFVAEKIKSL